MALKIIVSYDDTDNDRDALALGRLLAFSGAELSLAYVRHSFGESLDQHAAEELLARGAESVGTPDMPKYVVINPATSVGLAEVAAQEHADVIVFGSEYRTANGLVKPGISAHKLLLGGGSAIAVAPSGLRSNPALSVNTVGVIDDFGADRESLASLAALTPNESAFQPGFERADTTVQAVAPYYGVYDFTDAENMCELMLPFLEQFVIKKRYAEAPERFQAASPISYVHGEAPPFFVLHGEKDEVVPRGQARAFCAALRGTGAATVAYAELANAHHAFDIISTVRSRLAANAVADFLGVVYGRRQSALLDSLPLSATSAS